MKDIGLMAVANNQELQLWDVKSKAYYGMLAVVPPEFNYSRIGLVEYIKEYNKIAIVWNELTIKTENGDTVFVDRLYLYDAITLAPDTANSLEPGGMAKLLKYKYGSKAELPVLKDEMGIYRYNFNTASGQLLTINRKGEVNIYKNTLWQKMIATGARQSSIIFPAKKETAFYVTDKYTGILTEFNLQTAKKTDILNLAFIPNYGTRNNDAALLTSVTPIPSQNMICIVDSVNRLRTLETNNSRVENINLPNIKGATLVAFIPDWADSSMYAIAEAQAPPYNRISVYTNLRTGIMNSFSGGITPSFSAVSATGLDSKFKMVVSGLNEIEVDLSTLTEKNISQFTTAYDENLLIAGELEDSYFQLLKNKTDNNEIRVFKKDSSNSSLLYAQPVTLKEGEMLAGIFPLKKWYVTAKPINSDFSKNLLQFYDSTGKLLKSIDTYVPIQMLHTSWLRKQHMFSGDGRYFMLKEIRKIQPPLDSCRLRIFSADDFTLIADYLFTEASDFNPYNHFTASFTDKGNGYYFIASKAGGQGSFSNTLYHYALAEKKAEKKRETKLCLDDSCLLSFRVRNIKPNKDGTKILWFGFVPPDFSLQKESYQVALITNTETGKHQGGMNLVPMPELMSVLPFPNYMGFQFLDHIEFVRVEKGQEVPGPFLTVTPFVNVKTHELSMQYFAYDYINKTPWYYEKTNNDDCISFRLGASSYRRRQFDINYNRPDMVLSNIPGYDTLFKQLYFVAVSKRAERIPNMPEVFNTREIPTLNLEATKYNKTGSLAITVKVSTVLPVNKLYVTINGNRLEEPVSIKGSNSTAVVETVLDFDETLTNGENNIEVTAVTASGIKSLPLRFSQAHNSPDEKPDLHLLAISVGKYTGGLADLPFAVKDGRDVSTLINNFKKDTVYKNIFIDTLFDEAVSQEAVFRWIKDKRALAPSDHIILFYSGHGFLDSSLNLRLATSTTDNRWPEKNSIDYENTLKELDMSPARQKLMLIDACNSGDFDRSAVQKINEGVNKEANTNSKGIAIRHLKSMNNSFEIMQNLFSFSELGKGTVVISASGGTQSAFEAAKYKNGYFTYALKEALAEGKASDDPARRVWLFQLVKYLKQRVTEMSGGKQNPNLRISNPDLDWQIK